MVELTTNYSYLNPTTDSENDPMKGLIIKPTNFSQHLQTSSVFQSDASTIGKAVFVVVVLAVALMGNLFIIFSFFRNFKMRTITNTLVVNLCFTDTFSCALDLPFYIAVIGLWRPFTDDQTPCQVFVFLDHLLKVASILSMTGIALDRYFNLVRITGRRMTLEKARIVISWCWLQSIIAAVPWNLCAPQSPHLQRIKQVLCFHYPYFFEPGMGIDSIAVFFKTTCVLLPVFFIYYVSYRIIKAVRRKRKIEVEETTSGVVTGISTERFAVQAFARSGVTAIILFGMYILCTAPFIVAILWKWMSHKHVLSPQTAFAVYFLFKLKCALFPILYISRNRIIMGYVQQKLSCCANSERKLTIRRRNENVSFITKNSSIQMLSRNRIRTSETLPNDFLKGNRSIINNFVDLRALEQNSNSSGNPP